MKVAAQRHQRLTLLLGLDTFGDDRKVQIGCERDDRTGHGPASLGGVHILNK